MKTSGAVILAVAIFLGCVAIGVMLRPHCGCGHREARHPVQGRYQLISGNSAEGGFIFFYLLDTATGECWARTETARSGVSTNDPGAHRWVAIPPKFAGQRMDK